MRKPREEIMRRYVEGAVVSATRLLRHWMSRGLSDEEALSRAIKQALNMIRSSGLSEEEILRTLKELKSVADKLISHIESESLKSSSS